MEAGLPPVYIFLDMLEYFALEVYELVDSLEFLSATTTRQAS
jgi:hypothetical protein